MPAAGQGAEPSEFVVEKYRQGSEYREVLLVLSDKPSPLLTPELLYTGLTRAKQRVRLFSGEAELAAAVVTRAERVSGLRSWWDEGG